MLARESDLAPWLDADVSRILEAARNQARTWNHRFFRAPHVLLAMLEQGVLDEAAVSAGADIEELREWCRDAAKNSFVSYDAATEPILEGVMANDLLIYARNAGRPLHMGDLVETILKSSVGVTTSESRKAPLRLTDIYEKFVSLSEGRNRPKPEGSGMSQREAVAGIDTILMRYAEEMRPEAIANGELLVETRRPEIIRLAGILGRMIRSNALLVGEPGVGKTAIVDGLAWWLSSAEAPPWLGKIALYAVSCGSLIAGSGYRGQLEERVQQLIDAAVLRPNMILFLDDIHMLADSGGSLFANVLNLFNPYLGRGNLRLIAATSTKGFETKLRPNEAFLRRFEIIKVEEPPKEQMIKILNGKVAALNAHYGVSADPKTIEIAYSTCERYMTSKRFPDKGISILDGAFEHARERKKSDNASPVTPLDVLAVVSRETGIPMGRLTEVAETRLKGFPHYLRGRIFGQERAIETVTAVVQDYMVDLDDPTKARASFMFVGPPGTGKTEMAKLVAEFLMGSAKALVRFNMSEFQTMESYQRLTGPPPGYVGFEEGGELTNRLTENPYSIVLFDEIEKAHPRVYDVLLQVLSDGHLMDNHGRVIDCKNALFAFTSNALGKEVSKLDERTIMMRLWEYPEGSRPGSMFRREFLNRIHHFVAFNPLSDADMKRIAAKEVERIIAQTQASQVLNSRISVREDVIAWICGQIDGGTEGARPVKSLVNRTIAHLITESYLNGTLRPGGEYSVYLDDKNKPVLH